MDKILNKLKNGTLRNARRTGSKEPYHVLKEDFYDMVKRRQLKISEVGFSIYLKGKAKRFGNPFKLADKTIYEELGTTRKVISKLKARLQLKGIIKYNAGIGKVWTEYTLLDSIMLPSVINKKG